MATRKSLREAIGLSGSTQLDLPTFGKLLDQIEGRLTPVEAKKADFEEVEKSMRGVLLDRINETLTPAIQKVLDVTAMGFLVAHSTTPAEFADGNILTLIVPEGAERDLFTPSEYVVITRAADFEDIAVCRKISWVVEIGEFVGEVVAAFGAPGPHSDLTLTATAGTTLAAAHALAEIRELREAVGADQQTVHADKAIVIQARLDVLQARLDALSAAELAEGHAQAAATFNPANFYTKVQSDALLAGVATSIANSSTADRLYARTLRDPVARLGIDPIIDYNFSSPQAIRYNNFARGTLGTFTDARSLIAPSHGLRIEHRSAMVAGALLEEASTNAIDHSEAFTAGNGWGGAAMTLDMAKANPAGNLGCYYPAGSGETLKTFDGLNASSLALSFFAAKRTGAEIFARVQVWQQIDGGGVQDVGILSANFDGNNPDQTFFKNITTTAYPNGWYRFTMQVLPRPVLSGVFTASSRIDIEGTAGSLPYFWGMQVEPGKIAASSYIPTSGAPVTRAVDVMLLNGADFAAVSTRTGVIFVEGMFRPPLNTGTTNQCVFALHDGTANNRVICYRQRSDNALLVFVNLGGVNVMSLNLGAVADWTTFRLAIKFADGLLEAALNGGVPLTTNGGNVPAYFTGLRLGANQAGNAQFTGTLRRFALGRAISLVPTAMLQEATAL